MSVTMFEHVNFGGWRSDLDYGFYNAVRRGGFLSPNPINDEISSFIVGPYTEVTFYEHENRGGDRIKFTNDTSTNQEHRSMELNWNDRVSSVEVIGLFGSERPMNEDVRDGLQGIILYAGYDQRASPVSEPFGFMTSQRFDVGDYNLPLNQTFERNGVPWMLKLGLQPKSATSITVGRGYYVNLFDQVDARATVRESTDDLQAIGWNNRVTRIEVRRLGV